MSKLRCQECGSDAEYCNCPAPLNEINASVLDLQAENTRLKEDNDDLSTRLDEQVSLGERAHEAIKRHMGEVERLKKVAVNLQAQLNKADEEGTYLRELADGYLARVGRSEKKNQKEWVELDTANKTIAEYERLVKKLNTLCDKCTKRERELGILYRCDLCENCTAVRALRALSEVKDGE